MRFLPAIDTSAIRSPTQLPIASRVRPKYDDGNSVINPIRPRVSTTKLDRNQIQMQEITKDNRENIVVGINPSCLKRLISIIPSTIYPMLMTVTAMAYEIMTIDSFSSTMVFT